MNTPGNSSISQNIFHSGGYFGQRGSKASSKRASITNMQGSAAQSTSMDGKPFAAPSINNVFSEGSTTKFKNKQSHNRSNKQTNNVFINRKKNDSVGSKPVCDIFAINQSEEAYDTSAAHQSSKIPYARNKGPTPVTNVFGIPSQDQPRTSNIKSSVNIFSSSQPFQNQNATSHMGNTVSKSSNAFIPAIHNNEYYAKDSATPVDASFATHLSDSKNDSGSSKHSSNLFSKFNVFAAASQAHTSSLEGQKSLRDVTSVAKVGRKSHYHQINQQVEHNKRVIFMQPIPSSLCNSDTISSYFAGENIQPEAILCEKDKKCAHVIFKSYEDAHKAIRITQPLFPKGPGLKLKWDFKQSWTAAELHNAQSSNRNYPDKSGKDANKKKWKDFEQQRQYHEDISFANSDEGQQEQFEDDTSTYNHQQPANSSGDVSRQPYDDIPIDNSVSSQSSSYASQDVSRMSQPDENSGSVSSRSSPFNQTMDANNKQELLGGELKPWEVVPTGIHDIFSRSSDLRDISSAKYVPIVGWPVLGPGLIGSCMDMCPAAEREFRVRTNDIQRFERPRITQENGSMTVCGRHLRDLLVKRHQRSAAGIMGTGMDFISAGEGSPHKADGEIGERIQKGQTSSDGVRHPVALAATCDYLFSREFLHADINGIQYLREFENNPHAKWPYPFEWDEPQTPPTFQELHEFLFNRTRSIRRDFSTQNFHYKGRNDPLVIDIHERIARYHAMASYELCESQDFQRKLNDTELNNTLKTLNELYDDAYDRAKDAANQAYRRGTFDSFAVAFESLPRIASPHESEMRSLYLLVHCLAVNDWAAQKSFLQKLPAHIVRSPEVKLALRSMRAAYTNNLHAFAREMKAATPLQACVMFSHLRLLQRGTAIQIAYAMRVNAPNLSQLKQLLCASNKTEVIAILREQRLGLSTYATMEELERNEQYNRNNMRMDDETTGKDDPDAMDEYDHAIHDDSVLTYLRLVRGRPRPEVVQTPGRLFKRPDLLSQVETYVLNDRSTFVCGDRWSYRSIVESMPIYGESHMQIGPGIKQVAKMHHLPSEKLESEYPRIARQTKSGRTTSTSAPLQTKEAPLHTSYEASVPATKSYIESPALVLNHTDQTVPLLSSPVEPARSQAPLSTESVYHSDKIKESTSLRSSMLPPSPVISIPCSTAAMPLSQASATTQPPVTLLGTLPVSSESIIADVSTTSAISAERAPLISHITPSISTKSDDSLIVSSTPKPALFERNVTMFEPSVPHLISTTALTSSANIFHSTKSSGTPAIPFAASLLSKESGLLRSNEPLPSSTIQLDDSKLPRQFLRAEGEAATSIKLEPWDAGSVGSQYSSSTQTPSHVIEHKPQARLIDDQQLSEIYEKMPGVKRRKIQRDLTEWQPSQVLLDFDKIQEGMGANLLDKMVQKPAVILATQQLRALWSDSTLSSPFGNVPWDCLMDYANVCRSIRVLFVPTAVSSTHRNLEKKVDTAIGLVIDWMTWQSLAHVHWDHFEIYCQRRAAGSLGNMANVELADGRVTLTHDVSSGRQIEENQELVVVKNFTIHSRAHLNDFLRAKSWSENAFVCVCVLWYLGNEPLDQMDKVLREQQQDSINNHVSFILTTLTPSSFDQFPLYFTDGMIEKLNRRIPSSVTTANRSPPCMQPSDSCCSLPQALTCIADIFAHVDQCNTVEETIEYWNHLVADPTLPTDNMNTTEQQFLLSFCILKQSNDISHVESLHQLEQIWLSLTFGTIYPEHGTLYPSLWEAGEAFRAKLQPKLTALIEEHTSWPKCFATITQEVASRMRIVFKHPIKTMLSLSECTSIAKNRMAVLSTFQPPTELGDVLTSEGLEQESCLESLLSTTGKDRVSTLEFTKLRPKVPPRSLNRSKRASLSVRTLEKLLADEIVNTQRFSKLLSQ